MARPADSPETPRSRARLTRLMREELRDGIHSVDEIAAITAELADRKVEALAVYRPLPIQEAFHASGAAERIVFGSNRSGKTLCACVEVARAVTAQDPHGKFPTQDGRAFLVGKDQKEIGQVLARKLLKAGAFKIIRDAQTKAWRAYRPWEEWDLAHKHQARPAPPLIPPRFIASIDWLKKKAFIPSVVKLFNGWEITFFSSEGKPPHGADIDLAHFDEEIVDCDWYPEMAARLIDRAGKFLWSATPQAGTDQLYDLHERANRGEPGVEQFFLLLDDNPHLSEEDRERFKGKMQDVEQYGVRVEGKFALEGRRVYPEWQAGTHLVDPFPVPHDWTRYLCVDPGRQVCAVLFCAVPPPGTAHGDAVFFYDELYLRKCNAELFGGRVATKVGDDAFEDFLIDNQESRKSDTGSGRNIDQQYREALERHKVASRRSQSGFHWGSTDVTGRVEAFRRWLLVRGDGTPRLRVFRGRCPNFENEIKGYRYEVDKHRFVTDKPRRVNDHLMYCAEALAAYGPRYVKPPRRQGKSGTHLYLEAKRKRRRAAAQGGAVSLAAGAARG